MEGQSAHFKKELSITQSHLEQSGYTKTLNENKQSTLADLNRKTEFRTRMKDNVHEKNIDRFLGDWYGTTKGLSQEWTKKAKANNINYRP